MKKILSLFSNSEKKSLLFFLFVIIAASLLAGAPFDSADKYIKIMNVISVGVGGFLWGIATSSKRVSIELKKLADERNELHIEALLAIENAKKVREQVKEYYANKTNKS